MRGTTSRKCTDEIRTCEGLQAESVQMRLDYKQKCTDEMRRDYKQKVYMRLEHEELQAESVQMRLEHVRDYKQKVYR